MVILEVGHFSEILFYLFNKILFNKTDDELPLVLERKNGSIGYICSNLSLFFPR